MQAPVLTDAVLADVCATDQRMVLDSECDLSTSGITGAATDVSFFLIYFLRSILHKEEKK